MKRSDAQQGSFLGPEYSDDDIEAFLKEEGIPYQLMQPHELEETVAALAAQIRANSSNSSKPPSSDGPKKHAPPSWRHRPFLMAAIAT